MRPLEVTLGGRPSLSSFASFSGHFPLEIRETPKHLENTLGTFGEYALLRSLCFCFFLYLEECMLRLTCRAQTCRTRHIIFPKCYALELRMPLLYLYMIHGKNKVGDCSPVEWAIAQKPLSRRNPSGGGPSIPIAKRCTL